MGNTGVRINEVGLYLNSLKTVYNWEFVLGFLCVVLYSQILYFYLERQHFSSDDVKEVCCRLQFSLCGKGLKKSKDIDLKKFDPELGFCEDIHSA